MGGRDYRRREPKKPKKGTKKQMIPSIIQPPASVEVIKKKRKPREEGEAEEE